MPVAVEGDRAIFAYIDPGMGTRSELDCWGETHRPLWEMLRECGWRVEVVAVAWEQELLDRAGRVLQSWVASDMSEAERGKPGGCTQPDSSDPQHGQLATPLDGLGLRVDTRLTYPSR